jgi:phage gp46-like protein
MADIRIVSAATLWETTADWNLLPNGFLDESEELANYVKLALLTDRTSAPYEVLPDPDSTDRKGWWGDYEAGPIWRGWAIGCKEWLLSRTKITSTGAWEGDTVVRAETYAREALRPLIDMRLCSHIEVQAARTERERIDLLVVVYRGPEPAVQLLFQDMWRQMQVIPIDNPYGWSA